MKAKVDDVRLAALERVAMETWDRGDIAREGILDLCADLRAVRGLPPEPERGEMSLRDSLAAAAHQAWVDENLRNGITSRLSSLSGEEQMVPFEQLSVEVRAYDYVLVDGLMDSLKKLGYRVVAEEANGSATDMGRRAAREPRGGTPAAGGSDLRATAR